MSAPVTTGNSLAEMAEQNMLLQFIIIIAAGSEDVTQPTCPLDDALPVVFC